MEANDFMRVKVTLHIGRNPELVAIRYNPAFDFSGLAREVLRSHVRGQEFHFSLQKQVNYVPKSLICYIYLDEKGDSDVINYLDELIIPKSAFIRNIMTHAIDGDFQFIYRDKELKNAMLTYQMDKRTKRKKQELEQKLKNLKRTGNND